MAFLDGMKDKLTQASQSAVQKTKELTELAKLNNTISEAENKISGLYGEIGYEIYRCYTEHPIPEVASFMDQIGELHKVIERSQAQIKAINNAHLCSNCGAKVGRGVIFCPECGVRIAAEAAKTGVCGNCGEPIAEEAAFCTSCGMKIE
jgi:hypothetical protein